MQEREEEEEGTRRERGIERPMRLVWEWPCAMWTMEAESMSGSWENKRTGLLRGGQESSAGPCTTTNAPPGQLTDSPCTSQRSL